jgi:hypothetical protein
MVVGPQAPAAPTDPGKGSITSASVLHTVLGQRKDSMTSALVLDTQLSRGGNQQQHPQIW